MKTYRFEIILAAIFLGLVVVFSSFHAPGKPLSKVEVDAYMGQLEKGMPWSDQEAVQILEHMRVWAEADDGRPVYMLNLMRYLKQLKPLPQVAGFTGTPAQANAYYEEQVMPILFGVGAYPLFASTMQGVLVGDAPSSNLITFDSAVDNWDSVLVVRYPSRRAFFELVTDPQYLKYVPYKAASVTVALVPMKGDLIMPLLNWALATVLLVLFLLLAWWRAVRRAR